MRGDERVDAIGIRLQDRFGVFVQHTVIGLGRAPPAQRPHEFILFDIGRRGAKLRRSAGDADALQLHLPESILRLHVALRQE